MLLHIAAIAVFTAAAAQKNAEPLDINTATTAQLRALPGMGAVYAQRVLEGRPYTAKNQLATRGVLPLAEYQRIAPLIIAHRDTPQTANNAAATAK